jgi:DNA-directed RNA polymerase subunit N (RpoN/RPB10)
MIMLKCANCGAELLEKGEKRGDVVQYDPVIILVSPCYSCSDKTNKLFERMKRFVEEHDKELKDATN